MKIQLKKAIMHKGQELKELDLCLDRLTGNDLIEVEEQAIKAGNNAFSATDFSRVYLIAVAARAMRIPVEVLRMMNASDFNAVVTEVRNFLQNSDSEASDEGEIPENLPETSSDGSQSDLPAQTLELQ